MAEEEFGEILFSFQKNSTEVVGCGLSSFKGRDYFYIRVFRASLDDPNGVIPTKKGIILATDLLPDVIEGLAAIRDIMSNNKVARVIPRGNREEIRIGVNEFKGSIYLYVRIFVKMKTGENEQFVPTRKGITVALSQHEALITMLVNLSKVINNAK